MHGQTTRVLTHIPVVSGRVVFEQEILVVGCPIFVHRALAEEVYLRALCSILRRPSTSYIHFRLKVIHCISSSRY